MSLNLPLYCLQQPLQQWLFPRLWIKIDFFYLKLTDLTFGIYPRLPCLDKL